MKMSKEYKENIEKIQMDLKHRKMPNLTHVKKYANLYYYEMSFKKSISRHKSEVWCWWGYEGEGTQNMHVGI